MAAPQPLTGCQLDGNGLTWLMATAIVLSVIWIDAQDELIISNTAGTSINRNSLLCSATRQSGPNLPATSTPWCETNSSNSPISSAAFNRCVDAGKR